MTMPELRAVSGDYIDSQTQKLQIVQSSQLFAEACNGRVEDPREIIDLIYESNISNGWLLSDGGMQLQAICGSRWAVNGFPQVVLGAKHAAALAATKLPAEVLEVIRSPWNAWMLELPQDVFLMSDQHGKPTALRRLLIGCDESGWSFTAYSEGTAGLHRWCVPIEKLAEMPASEDQWNEALLFPCGGNTTIDERAMMVCGRLILGVALEMSSRANLHKEPKTPAPAWRKRTKGAPDIACRTYVLRADVSVDCRESVKDFILGRRSTAPAVQHLVRGHWKLQACGPKLSERKTIWVQPYWRGPEDGPVAMRTHLTAREDGKEHTL